MRSRKRYYTRLCDEARTCRNCAAGAYRRNVVLPSGPIPAQIVFIGTAPGKSEDMIGKPFCGNAGRLLDKMIHKAASLAGCDIPTYHLMNTVLCRTWVWIEADENYGWGREPTPDEANACRKYIEQFIAIVKPQHVVLLGRVPETYYTKKYKHSTYIAHPASMLQDGGQSSPDFLPNARKLSEVFREIK